MGLDKPSRTSQKAAMRFHAIVVAGGAGLRAGGATPKQWRPVAGKPLCRWSVEGLLKAGAQEVVVVAPVADLELAAGCLEGLQSVVVVPGGRERMDSVRAGLAALQPLDSSAVLIHDAARPFVGESHVQKLLASLDRSDGALPALPVSDTLKRADEHRRVLRTEDRRELFRAQTPQAFRWPVLRDAFAAWPVDEIPTDDAQIVERAGGRIVLVEGDPLLMKATYPEDFAMLELLAGTKRIVRTGLGFDAHRFGPGAGVWLCGILIDHDRALIGHSDADAGLHALTDALLGAVGEGDIGDHFPPTDPRWRGASSDIFLLHALELVRNKGGRVLNVDVTLICERPKIKPHRASMRQRLAALLDLPLDRVSVKATTTEGMGFAGREEGLAAQAIATLDTPA